MFLTQVSPLASEIISLNLNVATEGGVTKVASSRQTEALGNWGASGCMLSRSCSKSERVGTGAVGTYAVLIVVHLPLLLGRLVVLLLLAADAVAGRLAGRRGTGGGAYHIVRGHLHHILVGLEQAAGQVRLEALHEVGEHGARLMQLLLVLLRVRLAAEAARGGRACVGVAERAGGLVAAAAGQAVRVIGRGRVGRRRRVRPAACLVVGRGLAVVRRMSH